MLSDISGQHYVYLLRRPSNHQVFYVGLGKGTRVNHHEKLARKKRHFNSRVQDIILEEGGSILKEKIVDGVSRLESINLEAFWISFYGRESDGGLLANRNARGHSLSSESLAKKGEKLSGPENFFYGLVGNLHPRFGSHHTEETKKRISETKIGKLNPMSGKTAEKHHNHGKAISEKQRSQISDSLRGDKNPWYGVHGPSHFMFGRKASEETRRKLSELQSGERHHMYGKRHTDDSKAAIAETKRYDSAYYNGTNRKRDIEIVTMRNSGLPFPEIANTLGIPKHIVKRVVKLNVYSNPENEKYMLPEFRNAGHGQLPLAT